MSWKFPFALGIFLSFSPFSFNIGNYSFHYSIFGFGLMLLSFIIKSKDSFDIVLMSWLTLIIVVVAGNQNDWLFPLTMTFYFLMASRTLFSMKKRYHISAFIALIILFLIPILVSSLFWEILGLPSAEIFRAAAYFVIPALSIVMLLFDNEKKRGVLEPPAE